jgi:hypothetical protein
VPSFGGIVDVEIFWDKYQITEGVKRILVVEQACAIDSTHWDLKEKLTNLIKL